MQNAFNKETNTRISRCQISTAIMALSSFFFFFLFLLVVAFILFAHFASLSSSSSFSPFVDRTHCVCIPFSNFILCSCRLFYASYILFHTYSIIHYRQRVRSKSIYFVLFSESTYSLVLMLLPLLKCYMHSHAIK